MVWWKYSQEHYSTQRMGPKYCGEYCFACAILVALNTHYNVIFWWLLAQKYCGEYCFGSGNMCTESMGKWNLLAAVGAEIFRGNIVHENGIFWQLLVPKYFREYWFGFGIICAVKTYENEILLCLLGKYTHSIHMKVKYFGSLLVLRYFREYCFALGVICALNTHDNVIFQQLAVPKYTMEYCLWLGEHVHWIHVKVKSFGSIWCRSLSGNILLPSDWYAHSIHIKMRYFGSYWSRNISENGALPSV